MLETNLALRARRRRGAWLAALMATTAIGLTAPMAAVLAQTAAPGVALVDFNIPAQSLTEALIQFGRQAGLQVSADTGLVGDLRTGGVRGAMPTEQALATLLAGTGLTYQINGGMVALHRVPQGNSDGAVPLNPVTVTAYLGPADTPFRTAGSSAYITADQIQRIPPVSTGDMFRNTPGIISTGNRNGISLNLNVRGLQGMNRVATLVDGAQQSTSTYRGYGGHDSRTFVDPELLGGIEIEKGPGSGAYGSGSMGGVVNMRTLEASDIVAEGNDYGFRLRGSIGSNSSSQREIWPVSIDQPQKFEGVDFLTLTNRSGSAVGAYVGANFEVLAAIAHRKNGNYFAGNEGESQVELIAPRSMNVSRHPVSRSKPGGEVFNTSQDTTTILVKGKVTFGDGHSVRLGYTRQYSIYGEEYPDGNNPYSQWAWIGQAPLSDVAANTYTANYAWTPADIEWIDFRANIWMSNIEDNWTAFNSTSEVFTRGAEIWNTSKFDTGLGAFNVRYGGQYTVESADQAATGAYNDNRTFNGRRTIGALFTQADLDVTDWLRVSGGVRYETYALEGENWRTTLEDQDSDKVLPRVGITLTPIHGFQLFGTYTEGWRPPSVRETLLDMEGLISPNPYLRPETSKSYEVGANFLRDGVLAEDDRLRLKLAYFHNDYEDFITREYGMRVGLPFNYRTFANIPTVKFRGIEFSLSYDSGMFFAEGNVNYYTDVKFCAPLGATADAPCNDFTTDTDYGSYSVPPEYAGSLTLGTRLLDETLTLGARVTVAGERAIGRFSQSSSMIPSGWIAYDVYDAFASYKVDETFTVDLSAENVFDRYCLDAISSALTPSPGRMVRTTLTARF